MDMQFIFDQIPSKKVTTHYHFALLAYLSVTEDTVWVWCSVNEEWIESSIDVSTSVVFSFSKFYELGFSVIGQTKCPCGALGDITVTKTEASFDCNCGHFVDMNISEAIRCCV